MALLASSLTGLLWIRTEKLTVESQGFQQVGDDHIYRFMAEHAVGAFHIAPWSWRLLVPALAHYMPLRIQVNFEIIAFSSIAVTAVLVFYILRKWGFTVGLSYAGLILFFGMGYATKFTMRDFWLTDSTAFVFIAAAILSLQYRRLLIFATCIFIGTLAKESTMFAVPLCYTFTAERRWDGRALTRAFAGAGPAVMALITLRLAIPAWNGHIRYVASLPGSVRSDIGNVASYNLVTVAIKELAARSHVWLPNIAEVLTSFGSLGLVLPMIGSRYLGEVAKRFWPFLILVLVQLIFTYNTQRLIVLAFVPVIIASLQGFQIISKKFGAETWVLISAASLTLAAELLSRTASSASPILQITVLVALIVLVITSRALRGSSTQMRVIGTLSAFRERTPYKGIPIALADESRTADDGA